MALHEEQQDQGQEAFFKEGRKRHWRLESQSEGLRQFVAINSH